MSISHGLHIGFTCRLCCWSSASVPPPNRSRHASPPVRCVVRPRGGPCNRLERDLSLPHFPWYRPGRAAQSGWSRAHSRAPFRNYGYAQHNFRLDRSTSCKASIHRAACAGINPVPVVFLSLASGELASLLNSSSVGAGVDDVWGRDACVALVLLPCAPFPCCQGDASVPSPFLTTPAPTGMPFPSPQITYEGS